MIRFACALVFLCALTLMASAQAPASKAPTLSASDALTFQAITQLAISAANECQNLDSYRKMLALKQSFTAAVEAAAPGYTLDWTKREPGLIAKVKTP